MEKSKTDWERIESDYRAGVLSLREIASSQGVSHVSVSKRAKKEGWTKDLSGKIARKAEELVNKAAVNSAVNSERAVTDKQVIEANATAITQVILSHRTDIAALREKARNYQQELDGCGEELSKRVSILKMLTDTQKTLIAAEREAFNMEAGALPEGDGSLNLKVTFGR